MKKGKLRVELVLAVVFTTVFFFTSQSLAVKPVEFGVSGARTKIGEGSQTWSAGFHSLATVGDNVYAVWVNQGVWYCLSEDGGRTWGPMVKVSQTSSGGASIAVSPAGTIHVVWDGRDAGGNFIGYSRSANNGNGWSSAVKVNGSIAASWAASVAADSLGNVHVAWHSSGADVYHSVSADGQTWNSTKVNITPDLGGQEPSIDLDGNNNIYLAWYGDGVYFSKSLNGGTIWSTPVPVSDNLYGAYCSLAVSDSSKIYIGWESPGEGVICAYTTDGGGTWNLSTVDTLSDISNLGVSLAVSPNGDVNIAWRNQRNSAIGPAGVYFSRSRDGGVSWPEVVAASNDGSTPNLAVDYNNKALIMWGGSSPSVISFTREQ
jgi:hypothetical protein